MKKIITIFSLMLFVFTLLGCAQNASIDQVANQLQIGFSTGDSITSVTSHVTLPQNSSLNPNATIIWASDHEDVIDMFGTFNQPQQTTEVKLTATITLQSETRVKSFYLNAIGSYQSYTVSYHIDDAVETIVIESGTTLSMPQHPVKANHQFIGWYSDPGFENIYIFGSTVHSDLNLYAKFDLIPFGSYQIQYYYQNLEDDNYVLEETITGTSAPGESISGSKNVSGFQINMSQSTLSGIIIEGETLELTVYFTRNTYSVIFMDGGQQVTEVSYKHGALIESITLSDKEGFDFYGWATSTSMSNHFDFDTPITSHLTLYADWRLDDTFTYEGYYEGADGLSGEPLLLFLRERVNTGKVLVSYGDARYILEEADRDPDNPNNVLTIFTRASVPGPWNHPTWEREHVWPNSRLGVPRVTNTTRNIGTDLHNLRAIQPAINGTKSNLLVGDAPFSHAGLYNDWFYPGDLDRGDLARIVLFMYVAYDYLQLVDHPLPVSSPDNYTVAGAKYGMISDILRWHLEDPVDDFERNRNNVIYQYQKNRNPFIDHPEFVEKIWGPITLSNGDQGVAVFYESQGTIQIDVYIIASQDRRKKFDA